MSHPHSKQQRPSTPEAHPVPAIGSTGPSAQAGTRTLKCKISRGLVVQGLPASAPGSKHVHVDRNKDSGGDPFGSDDDKFMEAARAARTAASTGWEREGEGENFAGMLSTCLLKTVSGSWIRYAHSRRKQGTLSARYLLSKPTSCIE